MTVERSLDGRVVIVTGAGRGLGLAYALDLAARGASVVVNTRPRPADAAGSAERVVETIVAAGGRAVACALDVGADDAGDRLLDAAWSAFGRLDGLVNNAGVPEATTLHRQTVAQFRSIFETNFFGSLTVTLPIYRRMREQGAGRIVMTTSAAGLYGVHGMAAYSASKAAIIGLMQVVALEGGPRGVRCNAIAPYALTGMTDAYVDEAVAAAMPPEAVAPVVSWLVSERCPLNGETLVAGAGKVRAAWRIEGSGIDMGGAASPERLDDEVGRVLSQAGWTCPTDGQAAFEAFIADRVAATTS